MSRRPPQVPRCRAKDGLAGEKAGLPPRRRGVGDGERRGGRSPAGARTAAPLLRDLRAHETQRRVEDHPRRPLTSRGRAPPFGWKFVKRLTTLATRAYLAAASPGVGHRTRGRT